jgi:N-acetylmuramoyl-L-alanine amidase
MRSTAKLPLVLLFFLILLCFPERMFANATITVNVNTLNVREDAAISSPIIAQIQKGDTFIISDEQGKWVKIKLDDETYGWIAGWLVERSETTSKIVYSNVKKLNVRQGPSTSSPSLGQINSDERFTYISQSGDWTKINYNNTEAWVASWLITITTSTDVTHESETKIDSEAAVIEVDILNVRKDPTTKSNIVGRLKKGMTVSVIDVSDGWYKVQFDNQTGWIASNYVKTTSQNSLGTQTVTANILNIRQSPSTSASIVGKLKEGDTVSVFVEQKGWKKIKDGNGLEGWVASEFLSKVNLEEPNKVKEEENKEINNPPAIIVNFNGTNIRSAASTRANVIERANKGDKYSIISKEGDWYVISLSNNKTGYIAGWIVSTTTEMPTVDNPNNTKELAGKTIVLDPGHGGRDGGTIGAKGTLEKHLTLSTAKLLAEQLTSAGAKVIFTHSDDRYVSLGYRISISHHYKADAFISIHYNSSFDSSAGGITSFYYHRTKDKPLVDAIHEQLVNKTNLRNRYSQFGNYYVLRGNKQPAALLELGFLSQPQEEALVKTSQYQQRAAEAIATGLINYFTKK